MVPGAGGAASEGLHLQYGSGFIYEAQVAAGRQIMPIPLTVTASLAASSGIALAHDPSDALLGAFVDLYGQNVSFGRLYNRLGLGAAPASDQGDGANFTLHFVPLSGPDWRPAFAWARSAFPAYFLPASMVTKMNPGNDTVAGAHVPPSLAFGLGVYSCADASDMNASFLGAVGATSIWDAHFFWPYQVQFCNRLGLVTCISYDLKTKKPTMVSHLRGIPQGMFLPPNDTWVSNTGSGEELDCGAWTHGTLASLGRINSSYAAARAAELRTLSYFNLFHFGENVPDPLPPAPSPPQQDAWVTSALFLAQNLSASVLNPMEYDWQNSIVLDPGEPGRADFLVAQAAAKVDAFGPLFSGIASESLNRTQCSIV